jgi:signal transduction histidine kinase
MELLTSSFIAALTVLVIISTLIGLIVAFRFFRPIHDLERTVNDVIKTGRIEGRIIERKGRGELEALVVSFNQMLQKIEELVLGMKGALDTVAHDLRTPLTRFRMISDKALTIQSFETDKQAADEYRAALELAVVESDTVLRMMTLLMDISEAETGTLKLNKTEFIPLEKIREIVDVYELAAEEKDISIRISSNCYEGSLTADADRFRQAVGNMFDNAVKYGRTGGSVNVSIRKDERSVSVCVSDDGNGIAKEDLSEIWKRLYRGKTSKDGLGLGLSIVNAVAKAHGGSAGVESSLGEGSAFTISFPV